jgi:CRP-like cAMP-binding protein
VKTTPLFADFDEAALRDLAEITEELVLPPGQRLFEQGDGADSLYIIARGAVNVIVTTDGEEHVVDVLGGGDIIGEMALLTGEPRSASVGARTTVTLGKISREAFERLMQGNPALREKVWHGVAQRNFDNCLRGRQGFKHLDRDARRAWFERGRTRHLEAGAVDPAVIGPARHVFIVAGRIESEGKSHGPGSLLAIVDNCPLHVEKPGQFVFLPGAESVLAAEYAAAAQAGL